MNSFIANAIATRLSERQWSSKDLAAALKCSEQNIDQLMRGDFEMTCKLLLQLCAAFKTTAEHLFDVPLLIIISSDADPLLIDASVAFVLEECSKNNVSISKKEIGTWISLIYTASIESNLSVDQIQTLASTVVRFLTPAITDSVTCAHEQSR